MALGLQTKVETLLSLAHSLRDSDKKLLLAVWEREGLQLTPEQKAIFLERCSTAESITRVRRKLKDKYPASDAVTEARYTKFKDYRDTYGRPVLFKSY